MIKFIIDEEGLMADELVADIYKENPSLLIPKRSTKGSAGYDFIYPFKDSVVVEGHTEVLIESYVKIEMDPGIVGKMYSRSSLGIKKGIVLANGTGIIDSDFKLSVKIPLVNHNPDLILHSSRTTEKIKQEYPVIRTGEKIAQIVFVNHLVTDDDDTEEVRTGGIGSTGK